MPMFEKIAFIQADLFTGQMHTRLSEVLSVLAVASIVMWAVVALSIIARFVARLMVGHFHKPNQGKRNTPTA